MATPANNIERLVDVLAQQVQDIEAAFEQILLTAHPDPSDTGVVGQQLDGIGEIVALARQGLTDAVYRARLQTRLLILRSSGTPEDVIGVVEAFLAGASTVTYEVENDQYPAGFEITIDDPIAVGLGEQLGLAVRGAKAAGVNGYVLYQETIDAATFAFDGTNSAQFDYTDTDTNVGFGISGATGNRGTLDSSTTDLTTELAVDTIFTMSGFTNAGNNGIYRCIGTPTTTTALVKALDSRTLVNEAAGASVTLSTDGFGLYGSAG